MIIFNFVFSLSKNRFVLNIRLCPGTVVMCRRGLCTVKDMTGLSRIIFRFAPMRDFPPQFVGTAVCITGRLVQLRDLQIFALKIVSAFFPFSFRLPYFYFVTRS